MQDLDQLQVITGGIVLVNDEEPFAEATEARSQFSDYAYWQPNLRTDAKGEAYFQATFPDNITAWRSYVLGMDRRARAGMTVQTTQAFKALQAQLSLPRFVVAGDRFDAVGRVRNLLADSTEIRTQFVFEGKTLKENTRRIGSSLVEMQSLERHKMQIVSHLRTICKVANRQTASSAVSLFCRWAFWSEMVNSSCSKGTPPVRYRSILRAALCRGPLPFQCLAAAVGGFGLSKKLSLWLQ